MDKQTVYDHVPPLMQNALASVEGFLTRRHRYGSTYMETEAEYTRRGTWAWDALHQFGLSRRAQTLALASSTPYYSELFHSMGAEWHELVETPYYQSIPVTAKDAFRENTADFAPRPEVATDSVMRTSGTTGGSIGVPQSKSAVHEQWAVWWRYRKWHGIQHNEPCALFAGRRIMRPEQGEPYWRFNLASKELRFSTYHISEETASRYVDRLNQSNIRWIHGYASAVANLATLITEQGLSVDAPIKWVTLGGENVTALQMQTIEAAFGVHPIQHYGMAEGAANFSTCIHGELHVDEDFAGVEFQPTDLGTARILGTTYANRAIVLLRYDTGDLARVATGKHCACGFGGRIVQAFDGRGDETVRLPDGRLVGTPEEAFQSDFGLAQAQILQRLDGHLLVSYIPNSAWRSDSLATLEHRLRQYYGDSIAISFEQVKHIPRTSAGKTRLVIKEQSQ